MEDWTGVIEMKTIKNCFIEDLNVRILDDDKNYFLLLIEAVIDFQ